MVPDIKLLIASARPDSLQLKERLRVGLGRQTAVQMVNPWVNSLTGSSG